MHSSSHHLLTEKKHDTYAPMGCKWVNRLIITAHFMKEELKFQTKHFSQSTKLPNHVNKRNIFWVVSLHSVGQSLNNWFFVFRATVHAGLVLANLDSLPLTEKVMAPEQQKMSKSGSREGSRIFGNPFYHATRRWVISFGLI